MKKIMKVVSIVLTFALLLGAITIPSVATSAGESGDYNITITPPGKPSTLAGRTYVAYRILEATVSGKSVGYSICGHIKDYDDVLIAAIKAADGSIDIDTGAEDSEVLNALRELQKTNPSDDKMQDFAKSMLSSITTKMSEESGSGTDTEEDSFTAAYKTDLESPDNKAPGTHVYVSTADGVNQKFENLVGGYYIIVDQTTAGTGTVVSALSLDTTTETDISITAKVTEPYVEKTVVDAGSNNAADTADIGDTVSYKIESIIPDITGYKTYNYVITDTMHAGLTYTSKTLEIGLYKNDEDLSPYKLLEKGETYDQAERCTVTIPGGGKNQIVVSFTLAELQALQSQYKGYKLIITYDATINENAAIGFTDTTTNSVSLEYYNDPNSTSGGTKQTDDDTTKNYSFNLELDKVDATEDTELDGAVFRIYRKSGLSNQYAKFTTQDSGAGGTRIIASWGETPENKDDKNFTFTTAADTGTVTIQGLSADNTYYLEEVKAPAGHMQLVHPIVITIKPTWDAGHGALESATLTGAPNDPNTNSNDHLNTSHKDSVTTVKPAGSVAEVNTFKIFVDNMTGTELPSTGGMGTTLLYVVGGALVVIAGVLLISKRRMGAAR